MSPAEVAHAALEQTNRRLRQLVLDYATLCGELSKGLQPDDPAWHELQDLGARCWALDDRRKAERRRLEPDQAGETVEHLISDARQAIGAAVASKRQHAIVTLHERLESQRGAIERLQRQLQAADRGNADLATRLQDAERMAEIRERTIADLRADLRHQKPAITLRTERSDDAAVATLEHLAFTYHGGDLWLPPVGWPESQRGAPAGDAMYFGNVAKANEAAHKWLDERVRVLGQSAAQVDVDIANGARLLRLTNEAGELAAIAIVAPCGQGAQMLRWPASVPRETAGVEPDRPWPRR